MLANWVIARGRPWDERLAGWLAARLRRLVVQREVLDPAAYVELWLKDAGRHGGPDYLERVRHLARLVRGAGHRGGRLRLDQPAQGSARPRRGPASSSSSPTTSSSRSRPAVESLGRRAEHTPDRRRGTPAEPGAVDVVQETLGEPGAEDPETIVLRQQRGLRRARQVDTVEAALVGACDGELTRRADPRRPRPLLDRDRGDAAPRPYLPVVRELVARRVPRSRSEGPATGTPGHGNGWTDALP